MHQWLRVQMKVIECRIKAGVEMRGCLCTEARQLRFEIFLVLLRISWKIIWTPCAICNIWQFSVFQFLKVQFPVAHAILRTFQTSLVPMYNILGLCSHDFLHLSPCLVFFFRNLDHAMIVYQNMSFNHECLCLIQKSIPLRIWNTATKSTSKWGV